MSRCCISLDLPLKEIFAQQSCPYIEGRFQSIFGEGIISRIDRSIDVEQVSAASGVADSPRLLHPGKFSWLSLTFQSK
jgi:hypothetical protein